MKRLIRVELFEEHKAVNYYSIRFEDEEESLFDQFLAEFSGKKYETDLQSIVYWLDKIGSAGALERYFRPEGHPGVTAIPVPPPSSRLRLYCFRFSSNIVLLGGGGEKKTRTFQEDSELNEQVGIVRKAGMKIVRYQALKKVFTTGKELTGDLTFEIEI